MQSLSIANVALISRMHRRRHFRIRHVILIVDGEFLENVSKFSNRCCEFTWRRWLFGKRGPEIFATSENCLLTIYGETTWAVGSSLLLADVRFDRIVDLSTHHRPCLGVGDLLGGVRGRWWRFRLAQVETSPRLRRQASPTGR